MHFLLSYSNPSDIEPVAAYSCVASHFYYYSVAHRFGRFVHAILHIFRTLPVPHAKLDAFQMCAWWVDEPSPNVFEAIQQIKYPSTARTEAKCILVFFFCFVSCHSIQHKRETFAMQCIISQWCDADIKFTACGSIGKGKGKGIDNGKQNKVGKKWRTNGWQCSKTKKKTDVKQRMIN